MIKNVELSLNALFHKCDFQIIFLILVKYLIYLNFMNDVQVFTIIVARTVMLLDIGSFEKLTIKTTLLTWIERPRFDSRTVQGISVVLLIKIFSTVRSFALNICSSLYRSFSSLQGWRQQLLVNCLTASLGKMRWLNCALVNSMRLIVVIRSANYHTPPSHHQRVTFIDRVLTESNKSMWQTQQITFSQLVHTCSSF
jgi:hypothetical protein